MRVSTFSRMIPLLSAMMIGVTGTGNAQAHVSVAGTVFDSTTGDPIAGAIVRGPSSHAHTNATGRFALTDLRDRAVELIVLAIGYQPRVLRLDVSGRGSDVRIALVPQRIELEGVDVVANLHDDVMRSAAAITLLTPEALREARGQTLGETLIETPGVSVIQFGPGIAKPVIRGLHSHRVVTINQGVPQEGQQWGGEHAPEVDIFAAYEIEVVRGTANVLYGSDALGGVVRIEPRPIPTDPHLGGEVAFNAFSNNAQGAGSLMLESGGLPLPLLGRTGIQVRGSLRRAGDARTPSDVIRNSGFAEANGSLALGITRPWGRSEIRLSRFNTELGLYTGAHVGNLEDLQRAMERGPLDTEFSYDIAAPRQEVTHDMALWRTWWTAGPGTLDVHLGYQRNYRREYDNHGPLALRDVPAFGLKLFTYTADARLNHKPVGSVHGTFGVSYLHQANISSGKGFLIPQYWLNTGGVYVNEEVDVGRLKLSAGARYDLRWQRVFEFRIGTQDFLGEDRTYDGVAANFGWSLLLSEAWSLAGTVGRAWRAPNVNERFSLGVHHGTAQYEIGDATLTTEQSLNTDFTVRHSGDRTALEISAYRNAIDGYIYLHPREPILTIRGAYPAFEYRQTDATLYGIDVAGEVWPWQALALKAGGSLIRGSKETIGEPLYDQPADRLTLSARLTGGRDRPVVSPYLEIGTTLVRQQDQVPSVRVYALPTNGYALLNLEIGVERLWFQATPIEVNITVRNLLNTAYRDYLSRYKLFIDDSGRDIVLRARVPIGLARTAP